MSANSTKQTPEESSVKRTPWGTTPRAFASAIGTFFIPEQNDQTNVFAISICRCFDVWTFGKNRRYVCSPVHVLISVPAAVSSVFMMGSEAHRWRIETSSRFGMRSMSQAISAR